MSSLYSVGVAASTCLPTFAYPICSLEKSSISSFLLFEHANSFLYTLPSCLLYWQKFGRENGATNFHLPCELQSNLPSIPDSSTFSNRLSRMSYSSSEQQEERQEEEGIGRSVFSPISLSSELTPIATIPTHSQASHPDLLAPSPFSSSSSSPSRPSRIRDPHSTDWGDVDLWKFAAWMTLFSTIENGIFYPFWMLKTREQADRSRDYRALAYAKNQLSSILRTQGPKGLYKGFVTSSIVTLPAYGVYMGVYTWTKEKLGYRAADLDTGSFTSIAAPFVAGIVADAASVILYVPGDVVIQRLQLQNSPYQSFLDACIKIAKEEGISGFYRGLGATFLTSAIASAIWWAVYENAKKELYKRSGDAPKEGEGNANPTSAWGAITAVNRWPQLAAGFIAGTVTSTLINPLDVVKTRLQVQDTSSTPVALLTAPPSKYSSIWHGLKMVYADEGIKGYFRGVVPKLVSRGPLSAMSSLMYELVLYLARKEEGTDENTTRTD